MSDNNTCASYTDAYPSTSSGEHMPLASRSWLWKRTPVFATSESTIQIEAGVGNTPVLDCPVTVNVLRPKSISELEDCMTESIDLPGSVPDVKEKSDNCSTCAVRNTNIDEKSNQIPQVASPKESFMKRLGLRIKQMSPFKQFTLDEQNDTALNQGKKTHRRNETTSEEPKLNAKAYIPYEYARFHIAKVVEDMHQMKNKHRQLFCEIEENLQAVGKENQGWSIQMLKKQHSDKITFFKEALKTYQDHIRKNNIYWAEMIQRLKDENNQLIQENTGIHIQNKQEYEKWENEKTEILERFSQKLGQLYSHQISTLKELQMSRLEIERIQEMLKPQQEIIREKLDKHLLQSTSELKLSDEQQQNDSQKMQDLKKNAKNGLNKLEETENAVMGKWATVIGAPEENQENDLYINMLESAEENVQQNVHMTSTNLEGTNETKIEAARIRLEKLKQTLSKREAEIIELLKNNNELENDFGTWSKSQVAQFDTSRVVLLKRILEKLHFIYNEVPEAQQLIDNLLNDSLRKTIEAKESLDKVQQDMKNAERVTDGKSTDFTRDQIPEEFLSLEEVQVDLWEAEILLEVLSTIRSGCINDQLNFIIAGSQKIQEPKFGLDLGREKIKHPFAADINISHGQRLKDNLDGRTLGEQNSTSAGWMSSANKLQTLQDELEQLKLENKNLVKNLNTEKTLRKKYCNMVEDLKGKIHVFCRIRPLSKSELTHGSQCIVQSADEYTVTIKSSHGVKEFQFDQVFDGSTSQEESFRDINRLIESAVDGYNVCIFAYGQTGSGKTFTMIGEKEPANLGIIPRAFKRIFQIIHENQANFTFKVLTYMLELHNDQLLDLFINPCEGSTTKLEVRRDRKGFVYIQGAEIKEVTNAEMLYALFEQGCTNRHTAATKTNNENSRSHLIVGVTIKSTSLSDGAVSYGKLSMIDLAGSERAFKTGATDDHLKEANSINESLRSLGDVISALSGEQSFIPYHSNKLTLLMQDSLGGNSKTLMFVNISPADYNAEESISSLTYASRVKLITNNAQKNSEI